MHLGTRPLGQTGLEVSELCYGTWRFGRETGGETETTKDEAFAILDAFAEAGGTFIDTANVYGTPSGRAERWIGEWLAEHDRDRFVIASKVYFTMDASHPNGSGLSRRHIRRQIAGTLQRLDTDYLDLYYIHRWDPTTPITETMGALDGLVTDGRVMYLGASTMAAWQLMKAIGTAREHGFEPFRVTQPLFHAGYYHDVAEYLAVCASEGLAVCPYSPLAGGFLTGKYSRADPEDPTAVTGPDGARASIDERFAEFYLSERGWAVLEAVRAVADELDATPAQVAVRWLMQYPDAPVIPIIGARSTDQLADTLGAATVELSDAQYDRIMQARYDAAGRIITGG
ncbi:MAG: aldo/keto reductase [Haloquadratum sp.]|jgi:aryl-alcohol dehydrogenase-like predicted oxidoreductase|nr:aldo/keto reductase [Haloferacaceae archaeon]MDR9445566.1 aldo/keto reductase [Haloquadratum sp.]